MNTKILLTKMLAITGTVLDWLPIIGTIVLSAVSTIGSGIFLFDFLMPAEFFPLAIGGSLLLLWAGLRAKRLARPISWALDGVIGFFVLSQAVAILTGLSSGAVVNGGWQENLANGLLAGYVLSVIAMGVLGIRLVVSLFEPVKQ
jgi:hypothetical protein